VKDAIDDILLSRAGEPAGISRAITASYSAHAVLAALILFAPRLWFAPKPDEKPMTISLAGSIGTATTQGMTAVAPKTVEAVAPEPKRPAPTPVATKKPDTEAMVVKPAPKLPPEPVRTAPPAVAKPPSQGSQLQTGKAVADTRGVTQSSGLSSSTSGGTGASIAAPTDFCCPTYIGLLQVLIQSKWQRTQAVHGVTVLMFTIHRDGSIDSIQVEQSGGAILDWASRAALESINRRVNPLPVEYSGQTLTVHMTFPY
jgi:outer membrane biosynthesis protein TonB